MSPGSTGRGFVWSSFMRTHSEIRSRIPWPPPIFRSHSVAAMSFLIQERAGQRRTKREMRVSGIEAGNAS